MVDVDDADGDRQPGKHQQGGQLGEGGITNKGDAEQGGGEFDQGGAHRS